MTRGVITRVLAVFFLVNLTFAVAPIDSQENVNSCGVSSVRTSFIVRGQTFPHGAFPWLVALLRKFDNKAAHFFCGGTIISPNFVISAAHCIHQKRNLYRLSHRDVVALFGAHDLGELFDANKTKIRLNPKRIIVHEDWNTTADLYDADIAILEFEDGKVIFSPYIQPICYWTATEEPVADEGIIAGWGRNEDSSRLFQEIPRKAQVKLEVNDRCFFKFKELLSLSSDRTFCAGRENGTGVCNGDSGGGLIINVGGINYLKGIISSGLLKDVNCDVYKHAVYTDVLKFTDWITEKTDGAFAIYRPPNVTVLCETKSADSWFNDKQIQICELKVVIDTEFHVLGSDIDTTTRGFHLHDDFYSKYLPRCIGEKLPDLEEFAVYGTGLLAVRDYYLSNLKKLRFLTLYGNDIAIVEPKAFADLANVEELRLQHNRIGTLDEGIFSAMAKLKKVYLNNNNLKVLLPELFTTQDATLSLVNLDSNECIDKYYNVNNLYRLKDDLEVKCKRLEEAVTVNPESSLV